MSNLLSEETKTNAPSYLTDIEFCKNLESKQKFNKHIFKRVSAVKVVFENIEFLYTVFDDCYFRNCKFIDCKFTGAQFKNSSFRGSEFTGSTFDYARFNNTKITNKLIETNIPGYENVALEFAQALRVNFAQMGDYVGVNKAIKAELSATKVHLSKAAWGKDGWYKKKYVGFFDRVVAIKDYFIFSLFDFLWGNGESLPKLLRTIVIVVALLVSHIYMQGNELCISISSAFSIFLGVETNAVIGKSIVYLAVTGRFILMGMFVSVLVKRLSRR
ncbi:MAG: hypothetical protein ACI9T9_000513 [Oleiphilaceae bacterium]|jgi:hypothetical protein